MKYCSECGTKAHDSEIFCSECGERFPNKKTSLNLSNFFNKITSTTITTSKKLITKLKSDESKAAIKSLTKNKKVKLTLYSFITLFLFVIIASFFINKVYNPKNTINNFKDSILKSDIDALKKVLYSRNLDIENNDESLQYIINYFNNNNKDFDKILNQLENDGDDYSTLKFEGSQALLEVNEVFALTIKEKNLFFTKYAIVIKPIYLTISSNYLKSDIFINDKDYSTIDEFEDSISVGPLMPNNYTITLKSKDFFDKDISETISIKPSTLNELYSLEETYPLNFFTEYETILIDTNVPEATIFINGENTKIQVQDTDDDFGPISCNDKIYLSINANGKTYKTQEKYASNSYGSLSLDFTYLDYYEIKEYIESNPNAFNNKTNSENVDSNSIQVSSTAQKYIDKYSSKDYIIPNSDTVELNFKTLNDYTAEELRIASNEILARHGYVNNSNSNLVSYFKSKSWYKENPLYNSSELSEIETNNYKLMKSLEFLKLSYASYPSISADYVFANSDSVELSENQISSLNDWELVVARNEIFARYGLHFSTKELFEHFSSKSWFIIDSSVGNDVQLTAIEYKNTTAILEEENRRIDEIINCDLGE